MFVQTVKLVWSCDCLCDRRDVWRKKKKKVTDQQHGHLHDLISAVFMAMPCHTPKFAFSFPASLSSLLSMSQTVTLHLLLDIDLCRKVDWRVKIRHTVSEF